MELIVAVYDDWGIGRDGTQPVALKADRKFFRETTKGCLVIAGRRTVEDFPGKKPLPGRENLLLTRQGGDYPGFTLCQSVEQAVELAEKADRAMVIGGGSVYTALLCRCKRAYLTIIDAAAENSDTFFPNLDKLPGWEIEEESEPMTENGITFRFVTYINNKHCDAHIPINPQHLPL